jgi:hypothetical protein
VGIVMISPVTKYTLGRLGLFLACALALVPVPLNFLVKLMIALLASFALQFLLLGKWRQEMIAHVDGTMARRRAEREKLRSALAGEDPPEEDQAKR